MENCKQLESLLLQPVEVSQNEKVNGKGLSLLGLPVTFESFPEHFALQFYSWSVSLVQNFPAARHAFRQALGVCVSNYCLFLETQTGEYDSWVKLYDCNSTIQDPGAVEVYMQPNLDYLMIPCLKQNWTRYTCLPCVYSKAQILIKVLKISYRTCVSWLKRLEKRKVKIVNLVADTKYSLPTFY